MWKEKMKFFIEGMNRGILKIVKECPFVPTHNINDVVVKKLEKDWTKDNKQKYAMRFERRNCHHYRSRS